MGFQLDEDIREAIKKSLPAEAGELLRERLEQADELEQAATKTGEQLAVLLKDNTELQSRIGGIECREAKATERESAIKQATLENTGRTREIDVAEKINAIRTEFIQTMLDHDKWVMQLVFGNRIIRSNVQESVPVACGEGVTTQYVDGKEQAFTTDVGEDLQPTERTTKTEEA